MAEVKGEGGEEEENNQSTFQMFPSSLSRLESRQIPGSSLQTSWAYIYLRILL